MEEAWRASLAEGIAEITVDLRARRITGMSFGGSHLTFRCQRCGVFCCKLGGPKLSDADINRLTQAGYDASEFLDVDRTSLRCKEDGSCIFLSFDPSIRLHKCSVYNLRPALCRLYPFQFEKSQRNSYTLKLIPCCNGVNTEGGKIIDMNFIAKTASDILLELIDVGFL